MKTITKIVINPISAQSKSNCKLTFQTIGKLSIFKSKPVKLGFMRLDFSTLTLTLLLSN